ncbi:uncharacterized protein G2W53_005094 [Senna tora]|uniref:Uncharacterized protein n=1 Tax=Senna tora TaxID=362788 RepID=A0A834XF16_9FABA|nr:uncharacterized protein G2W53_005094 [Senna tora]
MQEQWFSTDQKSLQGDSYLEKFGSVRAEYSEDF